MCPGAKMSSSMRWRQLWPCFAPGPGRNAHMQLSDHICYSAKQRSHEHMLIWQDLYSELAWGDHATFAYLCLAPRAALHQRWSTTAPQMHPQPDMSWLHHLWLKHPNGAVPQYRVWLISQFAA